MSVGYGCQKENKTSQNFKSILYILGFLFFFSALTYLNFGKNGGDSNMGESLGKDQQQRKENEGPLLTPDHEGTLIKAKNTTTSKTITTKQSSCTTPIDCIAAKSNRFAQRFFRVFNSNRAYSPLSLALSISVLHESTSDETKLQIAENFDAVFSPDELLSILKTFGPESSFRGLISTYFSVNDAVSTLNQSFITRMSSLARISLDDYRNQSSRTVEKINTYFSERTDGLLTNAAKSIKSESRSLLFNTFYFKNEWTLSFELRSSIPINFPSTSGASRIFRAVHQIAKVPYIADDSHQLIELEFKSDDYAMGFLLPKLEKKYKIVPVKIPPSFNYYTGGIISCNPNDPVCAGDVDHFVVIAGWGVDNTTGTEYWIGRNRYGSH